MLKARPKLGIVGAGVIGLSSAVRILERAPSSHITIMAEKYGNDTTTSGAAGVWGPYKMQETPLELVDRLALSSYRHLFSLFHSRDARQAGVSLVQSSYLYDDPEPQYPSWKDKVDGLKPLAPSQLAQLGGSKFGFTFDNVTVEGRYYLAYLESKIKSIGGENVRFVQKQLGSLEEIGGQFDAIVNCSGLGSRSLVNDELMAPIRGQIIRVEAPWLTGHYNFNDTYIIPNPHHGTVVLGGTSQVDNWSTVVSRDDRDRIWQGCIRLMPSLAEAKVKEDWVGLRPGRRQLRIEIDKDKGNLVHCYGHGGAGLTLGWGCAGEVVDMLASIGAV